ncbi:TIGR00730 family Rossman fold protein [Dokdonia sinensis]|uniref:Cytokinin riboside 5'-monophosphate phosphoribohydrolase n=1 Tax=Dokdonia sinensis TaxID=2479847 RepID=A0A3M0FUI2_9FLAO|nr:TIGR00730 family Rossman fold protein [Dokdonia sinensis]RMB56145.1 TIGR00730 family Rossman fold protein [Dokdonia sinensis]
MNNLKSICVFCGSSEGNDKAIVDVALQLGATMAQRDITLVYGAAKIGIMGKVAQGALDNDGKVIGVIPEFLKLKEVVHLGLTELIVNETMHERKMKMHEISDGFITLPGGFGTFEELFEIITWAQLGLHQKPIGLLNVNGFYDDLIAMLKTMVAKGFLKQENLELLLVDTSVEGLLAQIKDFKPQPVPKWLKVDRT